MIACAIILILLLLFATLPAALENLYSPDELTEMGICLENNYSAPRIRS
jgi:hypothetical protein